MMMRDYKMYTFEVRYVYRAHVRDDLGETTGRMMDATTEFTVLVVARSYAMAEAWIEQKHNASYQEHKNFDFQLVNTQDAPNLLIEWTA